MTKAKGDLADWLNLIIGNERWIEMAVKRNKVIEKVDAENKRLSADKIMQEQYWYEKKALYAYNTDISVATEKGISIGEKIGEKRGISIGEKRGINKIVKKLLKLGMNAKQINELTDISTKEIERLKKEEEHDIEK